MRRRHAASISRRLSGKPARSWMTRPSALSTVDAMNVGSRGANRREEGGKSIRRGMIWPSTR